MELTYETDRNVCCALLTQEIMEARLYIQLQTSKVMHTTRTTYITSESNRNVFEHVSNSGRAPPGIGAKALLEELPMLAERRSRRHHAERKVVDEYDDVSKVPSSCVAG